jgi:hypothetical protein
MAASWKPVASTLNGRTVDYNTLKSYERVGLRRRTWARLDSVEKALYRCTLWLTKARGKITSTKLLASIYEIFSKLLTTVRERMHRLGTARAQSLWNTYKLARVFEWAPEISKLLSRAEYVTYLGVMELNR